MPRDRVVLTHEDSDANERGEFNRFYRRGFTFIGVGVLFDLAAVVLIFLEHIVAGAAVAGIGMLIGMLSIREFNRANQSVEPQQRY